jgi:hypothetical protein
VAKHMTGTSTPQSISNVPLGWRFKPVEKATSWLWDIRLSSKVASVKQEHNLREEGNPCPLGLGGCQRSSPSSDTK